jgi:hypothetical protein
MAWVGRVARTEKMINALVYKTVLIKVNEEHLGEPRVKVKILLRRILKKLEVRV